MSPIDYRTSCDVTLEEKVTGHNNCLMPQRRPFRPLTPVGANASPTLSEGFIRDYLSPGAVYVPRSRSQSPSSGENSPTPRERAQRNFQVKENGESRTLGDARHLSRWLTQVEADAAITLSEGFTRDYISPGTTYVPGLRYTKTPVKRENSPLWTAESIEGHSSLDFELPRTPERAQPLPSGWPTAAEEGTSSASRLRWINQLLRHTTYTAGPHREPSNATGTPQALKHECPWKQASSNLGASGPRTPDRHVRSRWLTPAEGDTSPTLRDWVPVNYLAPVSSERSIYYSESLLPRAIPSGLNEGSTIAKETLSCDAPHIPERHFTDWLVETEGEVSPTLRDDSMSISDDDQPGATSLALIQESISVTEHSVSKSPQHRPAHRFSDSRAASKACVSLTLTDDSMSISDGDYPASPERSCTSREQHKLQKEAENTRDGPSGEKASEALTDNARMDIDIPHDRETEIRRPGRMTDEEFFRFETPGPGYWIARHPTHPPALSTGSIINNHNTIMHHHCDSVDAAELSPSITRGRRNSRAGSSDIEPRTPAQGSVANMRSHDEGTTSSAVKAIKEKHMTPPVVVNRIQTLIHESAHQPADYTPTPHWISHIPGTDIAIQRDAAVVSGTETSPTKTRRSKGTAKRSRPFNRARNRGVGDTRVDSVAFDAAGPSSAITIRRRMVTSPTKRREVAGQGQITYTDSGLAKKNDLPGEDDEDDDPEDELDSDENSHHYAKH